MWIFSTRGFVEGSKKLHSEADKGWTKLDCRALWGPFGSGINSCSSIECRREWFDSHNFSEKITNCHSCFPALLEKMDDCYLGDDPDEKVAIIGPSTTMKEEQLRILKKLDLISEVTFSARAQCHGQCAAEKCTCGQIARLNYPLESESEPPIEEALAVLTYNTAWLGKASPDALLKASEELILEPLDDQSRSHDFEVLRNVLSYTEILLLKVREHVGSTNIWHSSSKATLTDFSPVVLGA